MFVRCKAKLDPFVKISAYEAKLVALHGSCRTRRKIVEIRVKVEQRFSPDLIYYLPNPGITTEWTFGLGYDIAL